MRFVNEWDTLDVLAEARAICRFGDGELKYALMKQPIVAQRMDETLHLRLRQVLANDQPGVLVGIPPIYTELSKLNLDWINFYMWRELRDKTNPYFRGSSATWYSSFITRPEGIVGLMSDDYFDRFKELWADKHLIFVGNMRHVRQPGWHLHFLSPTELEHHELFDNAASVTVIPTPRKNAWDQYDALLSECREQAKNSADKDCLFLLSVGPTATVMAWDLARAGLRAFDFGQLPMIYDLFRHGGQPKHVHLQKWGERRHQASGPVLDVVVTSPDREALIALSQLLEGFRIDRTTRLELDAATLEKAAKVGSSLPLLKPDAEVLSVAWLLPGLVPAEGPFATILMSRHPFEVISHWFHTELHRTPLFEALQARSPSLRHWDDPLHQLTAFFVLWHQQLRDSLTTSSRFFRFRMEDPIGDWADQLSVWGHRGNPDLSKLHLPDLPFEKVRDVSAALKSDTLREAFTGLIEWLGYAPDLALTAAGRSMALKERGITPLPGFQRQDLINQVIEPELQGALVFDIGANQGNMTRVYTAAGARVVAVEPLEHLTCNNENFGPQVIVENVCVADREGHIDFYQCEVEASSSCSLEWQDGLLRDEREWSKAIVKPCLTLDTLIERHGLPTYIKVDVENLEGLVLSGLHQPVELLSFEYTGGYSENFKTCLAQIERLGFSELIAFEKNKIGNRKFARLVQLRDIEAAHQYFEGLPRFQQGDFLVVNRSPSRP
ncbi:FkbM family methyltransferase [Sulfidibacter corallicola]|uniref:FkbM family methyltransferase n=1 Tax=Sulfidibacter corallicola TaxID=2818388 RepID=A0A8A4TQB2_SULCO|nr:FkbM family methyltransferase [Sulfidibacter corallicola]QTD51374.1 FkbM family methyltransferase [Sulfidibacter corallicola]